MYFFFFPHFVKSPVSQERWQVVGMETILDVVQAE